MSFNWNGRGNGGTVWTQEITRYYYIVNETVTRVQPHGVQPVLSAGARMKITKREAHKFFVNGYVEFCSSNWNESTKLWDRITHRLTRGHIEKDVEVRVLTENIVSPEEVAPRSRKKKVDTGGKTG